MYKNIFLADDDTEDQEIFMEALKMVDSAIHLFSAPDGEAAFKVLNGDILEKPDLIFLDVNMPLLNGKQLLARLKSTKGLQDVPVIMYSTSFRPEDIQEINRLGAAHHLIKPTAFETLIHSLDDILARKW